MGRIKWYIKQLLPLKYESVFVEAGIRRKQVFRMWFGRCFNIQDYVQSELIGGPEFIELWRQYKLIHNYYVKNNQTYGFAD